VSTPINSTLSLRFRCLWACGCVLLFAFAAPGISADEPGLLRIGADIDYRPYSYLDSEGQPAGFDIEVLRLLAERLGLKAEFYLDSWDLVLSRLEEDRIDAVAGALFTISRTERFIFTEPYNTDTISIFVRRGSSIDTLRELEGRTAAVLQGDAIPETVLSANGINSERMTYETFTEALRSVSRGEADYCLIPHAVGIELSEVAEIDNLRVAGPPVYAIQYRLALHRSRGGFRDQINRELDALIGTSEYEELQAQWLRHERRELSFGAAIRYVAPVAVPAVIVLLIGWVWTLRRQVGRQTRELAEQSAELKAQATQDELTGLANRRLFNTIAEKELPRAKRQGELVSVLFMDLDHFKAINDTHGHAVGDAILKGFCRRASAELREYDILARYGGEEFVALIQDTNHSEAMRIAERIRASCEGRPFEVGAGRPPLRVTVSIGVAILSEDDHSLEELLRRADQAMYQAKRAGRDRVCAA
jgi:diguanylate cyclase (GGDEF)-like protein